MTGSSNDDIKRNATIRSPSAASCTVATVVAGEATFGIECSLRDHEHGPKCGHIAIQHGDHVGYLHDGNLHCKVKSILVQHVIESRDQKFGCQSKPTHATLDHEHNGTCGHERIPHDDHYDYLVGDELHHQHDGHCDSHGIIRRRYGRTQARARANKSFNIRRKDIHKSTSSLGGGDDGHGACDGHHDHASPTAAHAHATDATPKSVALSPDEIIKVPGVQPTSSSMASVTASAPWYHDSDTRSFVAMFFLTGSFFFVELIWGITGGSLALVADAMHMLSDAIALVVGFYALRVSRRGRTDTQTFGWIRMEVVAGLCNGMFLIGICFSICLESIQRFLEPASDDLEKNASTSLIVACIGLGMNIIGLFLFGHGGHGHSHGGGHGHSHGGGGGHDEHHETHGDDHGDHGHSHGGKSGGHGHSHSHGDSCATEMKSKNTAAPCDHGHSHGGSHGHGSHGTTRSSSGSNSTARYHHDGMHRELEGVDGAQKSVSNGPRNMNMHGVLLHVLGDAFGSVAVIISMCIIQYTNLPGRLYADPICSLVISFLILGSSVPLVRSCVAVLLQSVPAGIDLTAIQGELLAVDGVVEVHELHVWQLNTDKIIASVHVLVEHGCDWMSICDQLKLIFHSHKIHNSTLQPEYISRRQLRDIHRATRAARAIGSSNVGDTCHEPVCSNDCSSKYCCPPTVPSSTPLLISEHDEAQLVDDHDGHGHGTLTITHDTTAPIGTLTSTADDDMPDLVD